MSRVLVIDDDDALRENLLELLTEEGFEVEGAPDGKVGVAAALARPPEVIVCDIAMPVMDGKQVLAAIRSYPETEAVPFIFLTARARRSDVREGMDLGADDYLVKPYTARELLGAIRSRMARVAALSGGPTPIAAPADAGPVVRSDALRAVWDLAMKAARTDLSVLLMGETGTGKDVLAHAIHKASPRAGETFMPLNCAAIAENLIESELFGHEKGAFTGATGQKGLLQAANGGTVFLDEVGELPPAVQAKLLRVLEDRRVMRVGGRSFVDVDVRILSASNRDLAGGSESGAFRADLFYRLGAVVLTVPPLRERPADIAPLAERFAAAMARRMGRPAPGFTEPALSALASWEWRGNVRELRNVVERAVAFSDGAEMGPEHLPPEIRKSRQPDPPARPVAWKDLSTADKRTRVVWALEQSAGNQTRAAEVLGVSLRTLVNYIERFGLDRPRKGRD